MIDSALGTYHFLPWLRRGMTASLTTRDPLDQSPQSRAQLPVELTVNAHKIRVNTRVYGPGDVTGLDAAQIALTSPVPDTVDYPPNYLVGVDFSAEDLPWLFTPLRADDKGRLRPWMALIAVRDQPGVRLLPPGANTPLATIHISAPAAIERELPDLTESWAWAHVQIAGNPQPGQSLEEHLAANPQLGVSRILCPQKLQPNADYTACLVPAFAAGVEAGLGNNADISNLAPAWDHESLPDTIRLPIYHHWRFGTGDRGDFESLAKALKPRAVGPEVGTVQVDVGRPGPGLPGLDIDAAGRVLAFEGALRSPQTVTEVWPASARLPFEKSAKALIDPSDDDAIDPIIGPVLAPPLYGRWHAAVENLPTESAHWIAALNLDPRYRSSAGLATEVIRHDQEALMEEAWAQVADILAVNHELRRAQFARAVSAAIKKKHLDALSADHFVHITRPAHRRLVTGSKTMFAAAENSVVAGATLTGALRRFARPRGTIARRQSKAVWQALPFQINAEKISPAKPRTTPDGTTILDNVKGTSSVGGIRGARRFIDGQLMTGHLSPKAILKTAPQPRFKIRLHPKDDRVLQPATGTGDSRDAAAFKSAAAAILQSAQGIVRSTAPAKKAALDFTALKSTLSAKLNPEATIVNRVFGRLSIPDNVWQPEDPLEPVLAYPSFSRPMYEALAELSEDHIIPGLEHIPPDTVTLLETNPPVIESFMVGLNHEMASELLWREYPTDQRGSYFRQFWDPGARLTAKLSAAQQEELYDIPALHRFLASNSLGHNLIAGQANNQLVLLVRGELLRRFPTAIIYIEQANLQTDTNQLEPDGTIRWPVFHGQLQPDIHFVGFDIDETTASGTNETTDPGWYFVIQQQPTEPRFGLEVATAFADTLSPPKKWGELSWGHLSTQAAAADLSFIQVGSDLPNTTKITEPAGVTWGHNAAHMALALLQKPTRIAIHAKVMLRSDPDDG